MPNKRKIEAFGRDESGTHTLKSAAAGSTEHTENGGGGTDKGANRMDYGPVGNSKRVVRAFHELPRSKTGPMQLDAARSSEEERQFAHTGETMTDGGNSSGRTLKAVHTHIVEAFQGRSGTPDNQSTFRAKGST